MSLIKFSTDAIATLISNASSSPFLCGPFGDYTSSSGPRGFNGVSSGRIRIFKGALPSQNDLETVIPTSLRTTDRLITFSFSGYPWIVTTPNLIYITAPTPTAATASGTASWFAISSRDDSIVEAGGSQYLVGQITLPGGGGELVINDLNIVSGQTYSLGSISFKFPSTFSYP